MKIVTLTDKSSGKKLDVVAEQIKFIEDVDGGTHVVFGADMGRIVAEPKSAIYAILGVVPIAIATV